MDAPATKSFSGNAPSSRVAIPNALTRPEGRAKDCRTGFALAFAELAYCDLEYLPLSSYAGEGAVSLGHIRSVPQFLHVLATGG